MTKEDFRRRVESAAAHLGPVARNKAIKHHEAQGNTENRHVTECVELAGLFEPLLTTTTDDSSESVASDAATSLKGAEHLERIHPEVERVREELFGSIEPHFSSCAAATEWLGSLRVREDRSADELARAQRLHAEWLADPRRHEVEEITGVQSLVTLQAHTIPYVAPDGTHVTHAVVSHGSPFVKLETVSKHLANSTGFIRAAVVMHILCDYELALPSVRTTKVLTNGRRIFRVEFNSPDITKAQMMDLLRRVRDFWGRAGGRRLSEKDVRFLNLIEKEGGVPDSGRKAFFGKISDTCTAKKIGNYKNSGWRGSYRRWQRLMDRGTKLGNTEG